MGLLVTRAKQAQALESINKDFRTCFFTQLKEREGLDSPSKNSKKNKFQSLITKEIIIKK